MTDREFECPFFEASSKGHKSTGIKTNNSSIGISRISSSGSIHTSSRRFNESIHASGGLNENVQRKLTVYVILNERRQALMKNQEYKLTR